MDASKPDTYVGSRARQIYTLLGFHSAFCFNRRLFLQFMDRFGHGQHRFDNGAEHLLGIGTHICGRSKQPSREVVVDLALTVGSVTETVEVRGPGRSKTTAG